MQRVRIGLTGLAFVFLLVLLATALVRPSAEAPLTANTIGRAGTAAAPPPNGIDAGEPKEPLAELGVAPGNAEPNNAAQANLAAPAPAQR